MTTKTKSKNTTTPQDLMKASADLRTKIERVKKHIESTSVDEVQYSTLSRTAAGRLRSALQMISGYGPNLSCAQVASLLTVAMFPDRNLRQLAELASLPTSTMSRHMLDLSSYRRSRKGLEGEDRSRAPGLGLIDVVTPPDNLRERHYSLTQRGKALINVLETILAK